jgi:Mg-chelatase subunit ChlI
MCVSDSRLARPLVWINGFPGTGKHTIAKLFATLLDEGDPLLIDNHSLIDPVEAKFSRDHPNYQQERRRGREAVFKSFVEDPAFRTRIVIFTGERNQPPLTFLYPSLIQFRV